MVEQLRGGSNYRLIIGSFLLAILLVFAPENRIPGLRFLPLILVLYYWALMAPQLINVGVAWILAVLFDLIGGFPVGEYGVVLPVAVWVVTCSRETILTLGWFRSSLVIAALVAGSQLVRGGMHLVVGGTWDLYSMFGEVVVAIMIWPILGSILFRCQRRSVT